MAKSETKKRFDQLLQVMVTQPVPSERLAKEARTSKQADGASYWIIQPSESLDMPAMVTELTWFKYVIIPDVPRWERLGWLDVGSVGYYSQLLKWNRDSEPEYPEDDSQDRSTGRTGLDPGPAGFGDQFEV